MLYSRLSKGCKKRMRSEWPRLELGMELRSDEERMHALRQLGDLHERRIRRLA